MRVAGKTVVAGAVAGSATGSLSTVDGGGWIVLAFLAVGMSLIGGVVLPAVWFKRTERRRDARLVLHELLGAAGRRPGSAPQENEPT